MKTYQTKNDFTPYDVKSICDTAQKAWDKASPTSKQVIFTWNGKKYKSHLKAYQMEITTMDDLPIAARGF